MNKQKNTIDDELNQAPLEVKIAVDLIQMLEDNAFPIETTIKALEIVLQDFKNKTKLN